MWHLVNTTLVLIIVMAAVAVLGLAAAVWAVLRDARLRTERLADQVAAQELLSQQRAETIAAETQRDQAWADLTRASAQADEARAALQRARINYDAQRTADHAYLVGTIRRAIWPLGDPLAPTTPGLAGLIEAGQRTLAASHAPAPDRDRA